MTDNNFENSDNAFLENAEAVQWFNGMRGGAHILDSHITAIATIFGSDVPYQVRAAIDPSINEPSILMIDIMLPVDDEAAWEKIIAVQEILVARESELRDRARVKLPFGRIIVSLSGAPSNWSNLVEEID